MKNVVRYLKGSTDYGLFIPNTAKTIDCMGYTDADWARDLSHRRSRTGFVLFINSVPVIWTSKLQTSTSESTAEAEFTALASFIREVRWTRDTLTEIGFVQPTPTKILQDNLGSIA